MTRTTARRSAAAPAPPSQVPVAVLGATLVIAVLAVDPGAVQVFTTWKWVALAAGVPAALAATAATGPLRVGTLGLPLLAVGATVTASTAAGLAPTLSFVGAPFRNAGVITWLVWIALAIVGVTLADRDRSVRVHLADLLAFVLVVNAPVTVLQRLGVDPFGIESDLDRSRAWGTLGNASILAALAALSLPTVLGAARTATGAPRAVALRWAGVGAAVVVLGTTGSRGAAVGAAVGLAVLGLARREVRVHAAAAVVALAVVLVAVPGTSERVLGGSELATATATGRLELWTASVDLVDDHLLLGSGPETFRIRFPAVVDEDFVRAAGDDAVRDRAHNLVLDTLVTTGVAGLAALAWLVVAVVRHRDRDDPMAVVLGCGLVAHLVTLQFHFADPTVDAVAWFAAGTVVAVGSDPRPRTISDSVVAGVAGAAALVLGGFALRDVVADHRLAGALDRGDAAAVGEAADLAPDRLLYVQAAGRAALAAGEPLVALERAEEALEIAPGDPDLLIDRARALTAAALFGERDLAGAVVAWEDVVADAYPASGRSWLQYGIVLAESGRLDDATTAWTRAATLRPDDADPLRNLARLAELDGELDEAVRRWRAVLEIEPDDAEAMAALDRLG